MGIRQEDINELARIGHVFEVKQDIRECYRKLDEKLSRLMEMMNGKPSNRPLSLKEFGEQIGKSKSAVHRMCRCGEIEYEQPGGEGTSIYIPRSELGKFLGTPDEPED